MKDNAKDNHERRNISEEEKEINEKSNNRVMEQEQMMQKVPWLDIRLSEGMMTYLWDIINCLDSDGQSPSQSSKRYNAGNISRTTYMDDKWTTASGIQDEDNYLYKNVLKEMTEHVYYKDWSNYHDVYVSKIEPPPTFTLDKMWVNFQKQHEFNPPHYHIGLYSFVVFMKIPTHWKEQHELPIGFQSTAPRASDFQFILGLPQGRIQTFEIPLSPEDEGRLLFFPAWLHHQVFPFYGTEEERVTISGNILIDIK